MKSKKTVLPKIRFPEFKNDPEWKITTIDNAVYPVIREVPKPATEYTGLGVRNFGKGTFLKKNEDPAKNAMKTLYEVREKDLIVSITFAWEGSIAIVQEEDTGALVSHRFPTYLFKNEIAIPEFFQYIIIQKSFVYKLGVISPGGAGRNRVMNKKDFLKLPVFLPKVTEQQKISDCLTSLNELISAHTEKLEALRDHKKGLMQQLFPAEDEKVPALRFPEFRDSGEWEEKPLETVSDFINNKVAVNKLFLANYISTQNLLPDFAGVTNAANLPPSGNVTEYKKGDILISNIRPYLKKIWLSNREGGASNDVIVIRPRAQLLKELLAQILMRDAFVDYVMVAAKGLKMPRGDISQIKKYTIVYPTSLEEQQRIVDCLTSLDDLVTAQSDKIETLKLHKKGLIQQLFPSSEEVNG